MDFVMVAHSLEKGVIKIYPKFRVCNTKDLMIRGSDFYAFWNEEKGLWSTDEQDLIQTVDALLEEYAKENEEKLLEEYAAKFKTTFDVYIKILYMWDGDNKMIDKWHNYCKKQLRDRWKPLDTKITFANQTVTKEDYVSKKLGYRLEPGVFAAWDEILHTLYEPEEAQKIEWAIGAIITGDSKKIQKYLALYGPPGCGKGTILEIIQTLFEDYCNVFDAAVLGSNSAAFALEQFKGYPLVSLCFDGDLSRIEDNAKLNSLISHEKMQVNEKHKSMYIMQFITFLIMATNKPVKITDAKSGQIRRLIDVRPKGIKIPKTKYNALLKQIPFELGAIAYHCKEVYENNKNIYDDYNPFRMMEESNDFYNFVLEIQEEIEVNDGISLNQAWYKYKQWCEDANVPYPMKKMAFKAEFANYFEHFYDSRVKVGDEWVWYYYSGFKKKFMRNNMSEEEVKKEVTDNVEKYGFIFEEQPSYLDTYCKDCPAQYATVDEKPRKKWEDVTTTLKDINTSKVHYLKVPENLIVIDFDIRDENGNKSFELNLVEASKWPKTYAELSKSGGGIHLHYIYNGDIKALKRIYDNNPNIEIKTFTGNSSLRRKLTKCNNEPIVTLTSGLPLKEKDTMIDFKGYKDSDELIFFIRREINRETDRSTTVSINFIKKMLDDAYESGMTYDVSCLKTAVRNFAASSTHQAEFCLKQVTQMHFMSDDMLPPLDDNEKPLVFYDVEVFPNLFLVNWKYIGAKYKVNRMINPTKEEIDELIANNRLVGFNCRKYDNHILWGRHLGFTEMDLYKLSQDIIKRTKGFFGPAYNLSYTDIYDYAATKQSLKKWEIQLGIHHKELGMDWDTPVPKEKWYLVAEYCDNDVIATEAVWEATQPDFMAREILAKLVPVIHSEVKPMCVNDTTNSLTTKIIFGAVEHPVLNYVEAQKQLLKEFPGYTFEKKWDDNRKIYITKNMYRGTDLGFGGYVFAVPGLYGNVALVDVASLHPHTIIALNLFGEYTKFFADLVHIRVLIKHKELDKVREMFGGALAPYVTDMNSAKQLSQALKIAINSVYGLTSAKFDNPFRDAINNANNIVALRGALFMRTLQDEVLARGFKVAHIKTDSIKIPDATKEIVDFCMEFANKFGYTFEHEATYDRLCLVNDAVYIAKYAGNEEHDFILPSGEKVMTPWTATGAQFQIPYVFKTCFAKLPISFRDMCETKTVNSAMYIDQIESVDNRAEYLEEIDNRKNLAKAIAAGQEEKTIARKRALLKTQFKDITDEELELRAHNYKFVGKVGLFCPMQKGVGAGILVREQLKADGSKGMNAVTATDGYLWMESEDVKENNLEHFINIDYYEKMVQDAIDAISTYGDYNWFVSDDPYQPPVYVNGAPDYDNYCPF